MTPKIDKNFLCVVDIESQKLAAIVSSILVKLNEYLPMFQMHKVLCTKEHYQEYKKTEHDISNRKAEMVSVKLHKALQHLNKDAVIIYIGLSQNQLSYLDFFKDRNCISINDKNDAYLMLQEFIGEKEFYETSTTDILESLWIAVNENKVLKLNETAAANEEVQNKGDGLIVIERSEDCSSFLAVNYALSIGADIKVIEKPSISYLEIIDLLERWQKEKEKIHQLNLSAEIFPSIEDINFNKYKFATFFTYGAPYSLVAENIIPFTYIHTGLAPDFFVFNAILKEHRLSIQSAVIFSPSFFGTREETKFIEKELSKNGYYSIALVDDEASVANLGSYIEEFPFEILHLCSHGGKVDGYSIKDEFIDEEGKNHTFEYDEIVSLAPKAGEEKIRVTSKFLPRKLNGYNWGSEDLRSQNYPRHVYNALHEYFKNGSPKKDRTKKEDIVGSCSIVCKDFVYQAMFDQLAGSHISPFIFNNTCWSWLLISDSFLAEGASGYIGTLWNVDNDVATNVANTFYQEAFKGTILEALQSSLYHTDGTKDKHIYAYWGLHFSRLKSDIDVPEAKLRIADKILRSFYFWRERIREVEDVKLKEDIQRKIDWLQDKLSSKFMYESTINILVKKKQQESHRK